MILTDNQVERYKELSNPPQYLYTALYKQIHINRIGKARSFAVPKEGGYMAYAVYYYFLKQLDYDDKKCMTEMGCTYAMLIRIQLYLDHSIRFSEEGRVHTKIKLVRNYMLLEQLKIPYELLINVNQ